MRKRCERNVRAKRMLLLAFGAAVAALIFYCVPWWVFFAVAVVSLIAAGYLFLRQ